MEHKNREADVFREVIETYWLDVWNYAFFITKKYEMSDDITQDVFIKAYSHFETFQGNASIKTWLLKITRNTSYNYLKSAFFKKVTLVDFLSPKHTSPSTEQEFFDRQFTDEIWEAVMALPSKFREVLILDAKYELSIDEIANLLKIPEGTVKSRLYRARSKMSEWLKEVEK